MNIEEAKKIAASPLGGHLITESHDALRVLADALRAAEGQVRAALVPRRAGAGHICGGLACQVCDVNERLLSPAPAVAPVAAPKPGPTPDDDVLTARFQAVHRRLDVVEMYLRPLGFDPLKGMP